jgi:hypothetical protein
MKNPFFCNLISALACCGWLGLVPICDGAVEAYPLPQKAIEVEIHEPLLGALGVAQWTPPMAREVSGLTAVKCVGGKIGGTLVTGQALGFGIDFPDPGVDLDLGFRDFVDVEVSLPLKFQGRVFLDFTVAEPGGIALKRSMELPFGVLVRDGKSQSYRLDVGLVPEWRGFLKRLELTVAPALSQGGSVVLGRLLLGDRAGDEVEPNFDLNLKPGMKISELKMMESKHACIWWLPSHESEGFDPAIMPRRALRMIEETWQIAVNQLGYRDPCLGTEPTSKRRRKINHITWYDGFWMSGGDPPHFNVPAGGLLDEGWGNPVPHEFAHTVQGAQIDFLNGCHWESHANYIRFCRNYHFREFTGLDTIDFGVLLRSHYYQDHPRLIYADYRPYFYLDGDPDGLGFAPGLSGKLWQTGTKDGYFWERLPGLLPAGVTREQVAAGMARSWLTFAIDAGPQLRDSHFGSDPDGRIRWFRYMTPLDSVVDRPGWFAVPLAKAPMKFAWCFHELEATGRSVEVTLEGVDLAGAGENWRWGFVALMKDGKHLSSDIFPPGPGKFELPAAYEKLVLFVVATPSDGKLSYPRPTPDNAVDRHPEHRRYAYELHFRNVKPMARVFPADAPAGRAHRNGGGFVANSAAVDATAFVGPEARVLGNAQVRGMARVLDRAVVLDEAQLEGEAVVSGNAIVGGNAVIRDQARVRNHAFVGGQALIRERARVGDLTEIKEALELSGDAWARGVAAPIGGGKVSGHAILDGDYAMAFDLKDGVHFHHVPWGAWYFDEFAARLEKPRGLLASYQFGESDGAQAMDEFGALVATIRGQPERGDAKIELAGKAQYLLLDASLVDAPAATWLLNARFDEAKAQPLFCINDPAKHGVMLGLGASGVPTALLACEGRSSVVIASKMRVQTGVATQLALRLDGKSAALFVNGKLVAEQSWNVKPQEYFYDVTHPSATKVFLGRDAKGTSSRTSIFGFRAYNVALSQEEIAAP